MEQRDQHDPQVRMVRAVLPLEVHARLRHLSIDADVSMSELLQQAVVLLLRFHDRGQDLPEPARRPA